MNVDKVRSDFPILQKKFGGKPFVYFDSACTSLKPRQVIDAVVAYYTDYSACALRSVHKMAVRATEEFNKSREKVAKFVNAKKAEEIVWTKNTTEAINLVAYGLKLSRGDKVITTNLEHSSGLLPWQFKAKRDDINLDFVLCNKEGEFNIEDFKKKIDRKTKLVSIIHVSNVTATKSPLEEIVKVAHDNGSLVLVDGAQSVPHMSVDVRKLDIDFLAFSGHKTCGPTGIGCLYGKYDLLKGMEPFMVGGETIKDAELKSCTLEDVPFRFEAGIQHYSGAIGLGAAVDYLSSIGMKNVENHERELSKLLVDGLMGINGVELIGPKDYKKRVALAAFNIKGMEPHDVAIMLDNQNIFVRSGMHCAYPIHKFLQDPKGSVRASLYLYNTKEEVELFIEKLNTISKTFR
ncbi:MAG: SufS family cysteine desulfurase [Candidatus Aenigmatarchaeota archaeon]